jgi:hypothetical protein
MSARDPHSGLQVVVKSWVDFYSQWLGFSEKEEEGDTRSGYCLGRRGKKSVGVSWLPYFEVWLKDPSYQATVV